MVTWFFLITGFVACYPAQAQAAIHAPRAEHRVCTAEIQHQLSHTSPQTDALTLALHISIDDWLVSVSPVALPTWRVLLTPTQHQPIAKLHSAVWLSAFTSAHPPRGPPLA